MLKTLRIVATLALSAALLAVPATAPAAPGGQGKGKGKAKSCQKTRSVGFQVTGTLVSATQDDAATTDAFEGTVTLTVTAANSHARKSGELDDQNAESKGVQAVGATYTVPVTDVFALTLNGFAEPATPAAGDRVKVGGRIPVMKKRCAAEGVTTDDRYGTPDVRRVKISHSEPATETETETETAPAA